MRIRLLLLTAMLFLVAGLAQAANLTVGCAGSPPGTYDYASIQAALNALDVVGPHTITVTGTCTETVSILSRDRVTIEAPGGQTATLAHPAISDPDVDPVYNVISIVGSRNIYLRRLTVRGGAHGIVINSGSVVEVDHCNAEDNLINGIHTVNHSTLHLIAGTMRNNGNYGLSVVQNSQAVIRGLGADVVHIHDNWQGLYCTESSACQLNGPITVENNAMIGVIVSRTSAMRVAGSVLIRRNGQDGVLVNFTSWASFLGATIEENSGLGFNVQQNSTLVVSNLTVRNNVRSAFGLLALGYVAYATGNTVAGNAVPAFTCDSTSLLWMTESGTSFLPQELGCKNIQRGEVDENERPRPGRVH